MKSRNSILLVVLISVLAGCAGDIANIEKEEPSELAPHELDLRANMKQTALIITDLVRDPNVVKELKFAADYSLKELGRDEDIYFSELFSSDAPYKQALAKAKQNVSGNFAAAFRNEVKSTKAKGTTGEDLETYLQANSLKLYWPYSEYWNENVTPSISYHPLDNEDENEGFMPISPNSTYKSVTTYEIITMNDEYAMSNPSMLVVPCEEGPIAYKSVSSTTGCGGDGSGDGGDAGGTGSSGIINLKEDGDTAPQVYLGYVKLNKHYDGIFAGGSEVRFAFADVVQISPGELEVQTVTEKKFFTRPDIANKRWQKKMVVSDYRWNAYQKTLLYHIYEKDGDGTTQIAITSDIEDVNGTTVKIESSYKVHKNKDNIGKFLLDREIFLQLNQDDFPNGLKEGYHIYKKGGLESTLPHQLIDLND